MSSDLLSWVTGAPAGWRWCNAQWHGDGWLLQLADLQGTLHAFEVSVGPSARALRSGETLAVSHRGHVDDPERAKIYDQVAFGLLRDEVRLRQSLGNLPRDAAERRPAMRVHWSETELLLRTRGEPGRVAALLQPFAEGEPLVAELYLETPCKQACVFCQQPGRRRQLHHRGSLVLRDQARRLGRSLLGSGVFAALVKGLAARNPPATLVLTGHDWASDPEVVALLACLAAAPALGVSLLGPSTAFAKRAVLEQVCALPNLQGVTVTVLSADPRRHDALAGKSGAAAKLFGAIGELRRRKVRVGVNVVLCESALPELSGLLDWAQERGLRLNLLGFVPDQGPLDLQAQIPRWDLVCRELGKVLPEKLQCIEGLSRVPLCAVPSGLRSRCDRDRSRAVLAPPEPCTGCAQSHKCAWVAADYIAKFKDSGLQPLGEASAAAPQ